jgi:transposase
MEILSGRGYRQRWSDAAKAKIVAESLEPGIVVRELARRHGAHPSQVHGWRKDAREGRLALPVAPAAAFAEVVVTSPPKAPALHTEPKTSKFSPASSALIEIETDTIQVRVGAGADPALVSAIIRALKPSL